MNSAWPEHFPPALMRVARGKHLLSAYAISLEAWRRGLKVTVKHPEWAYYDISDGQKTVSFNYSRSTSLTTSAAYQLVQNKWKTSETLRRAGLPAPTSQAFPRESSSFPDVLEAAERIGYPVVLKPVRGSVGRGVFPNLSDEAELKAAFSKLLKASKSKYLLVEEHFPGDDYRIYVVGDQAVAATNRIPAHVVGNGESTISGLIQAKNTERAKNPGLSTSLLRPSQDIADHLARQGLTYDSVPDNGQTVFLRYKANASAGGDVVDVLDWLPQRIKDAAGQAVASIPGLAAAGVDVLLDRNRLDDPGSFRIIELNARAHFGGIMYPTVGTGRDVPKAVIDTFFPETPRRSWAAKLRHIGINAPHVLDPLRSGTVSEVKVAPLGRHSYGARRRWSITFPSAEVTEVQKTAIRKLAGSSSVFGYLDLRNKNLQAVAAGTGQQVRAFKAGLSTILKTELSQGRYHGLPTYSGFDIYE